MPQETGSVAGHILVLEEDESTARHLQRELELEGYRVDWITDGLKGLERARSPQVELMLLELDLPGLDGFRLLRALRRSGSTVPAVVLSGCAEESDKVLSLRSGADDFVCKPFATGELLARIEAHLRRARGAFASADSGHRSGSPLRSRELNGHGSSGRNGGGSRERSVPVPPQDARSSARSGGPATGGFRTRESGSSGPSPIGLGRRADPRWDRPFTPGPPEVIRLGSVEVDMAAHRVLKEGEEVGLTPKEFDLLVALARRGGAVASRRELLREVWDDKPRTQRTVDTHLFELRQKLEDDPANPTLFLTVRKVGYRLQPR